MRRSSILSKRIDPPTNSPTPGTSRSTGFTSNNRSPDFFMMRSQTSTTKSSIRSNKPFKSINGHSAST
ncbi:unnamed protein product [Schistosoma margrebowiei]|uniref:Uncharacterized protein n=1 Tax=Schistosoma margrebowiei TaxID=48269 RepID=A0A3P7WIU9_9TREM|nr:unnamed protein product [Schistosoma margrebowiei]